MKFPVIIIVGLTLLIRESVFAEEVLVKHFASGQAQVSLIELYTSEGCSSCPPADRWLSSLKKEDGLWKSFVPAAFHVDYWDYIGWKDPFASKEYSQRQRRYASEHKEATVYTPGVRKQGAEWRRWRFPGSNPSSSKEEVGNLEISVDADWAFSASFVPHDQGSKQFQLTVALLGLEIESEVTRGENRGKKLEHDFVVLGVTTLALAARSVGEQNKISWEGQLPGQHRSAPKYAVAAWLTEPASLNPVQVVGGTL